MSKSPYVFATLTPDSLRARIAFSESYDKILQESLTRHGHFMSVETKKIYDEDVHRFRLKQSKVTSSEISGDSDSTGSDNEVDTRAPPEYREMGMIWKGHYKFEIYNLPHNPVDGWRVGRGGTDVEVDILIAHKDLRTLHGSFNFHPEIGRICLTSKAKGAFDDVSVIGKRVDNGSFHAFNQRSTVLSMGFLTCSFEYTNFAKTEHFIYWREKHMQKFFNISSPKFGLTRIPLWPLRELVWDQPQDIWALGRRLDEHDGDDKTYVATNSQAHIVAIKVLHRASKTKKDRDRQEQIVKDIEHLQKVSKLCNDKQNGAWIQHMTNFNYPNQSKICTSEVFDEVLLILEPVAEFNFETLTSYARTIVEQ